MWFTIFPTIFLTENIHVSPVSVLACVISSGDKMSGETAHRDVAKFKLPEDEIFGGWLNLDTDPWVGWSKVIATSHDRKTPQKVAASEGKLDPGYFREI